MADPGEFRHLCAALAAAFLGAPLLAAGVVAAAGLQGQARALVGFGLLQGTLAAFGFGGWRRVAAGEAPGRLMDGVRGLVRGPALALLQMAGGWAVMVLARWGGLQGRVAELGQREQQALARLLQGAGPGWVAIWAVLLVLVAPVCEELFFRGYLYSVLRRQARLPPLGAAALSGAAFATLHGYVVHWVPLWLCGTLLALWYGSSGRLATAVGAHMAFNGLSFTLSLLGTLAASS